MGLCTWRRWTSLLPSQRELNKGLHGKNRLPRKATAESGLGGVSNHDAKSHRQAQLTANQATTNINVLVCLVPNKVETGIATISGQVRRPRHRELKERAPHHAGDEWRGQGPRPTGLQPVSGLLAQELLGYFLLPRMQCEPRQAAVWGSHSCPNSPRAA